MSTKRNISNNKITHIHWNIVVYICISRNNDRNYYNVIYKTQPTTHTDQKYIKTPHSFLPWTNAEKWTTQQRANLQQHAQKQYQQSETATHRVMLVKKSRHVCDARQRKHLSLRSLISPSLRFSWIINPVHKDWPWICKFTTCQVAWKDQRNGEKINNWNEMICKWGKYLMVSK
jgi:hypothetical protein